ncbi:MAG: hypothetical protein FVQ81_06700 [Candidatus Glassbacteria bacterium]|nr:hypothetical protein [Candidatus Glassbacteria bacterium]
MSYELLLEYLKLFLSPQMVIGAIVLLFIFIFRNELKCLLVRIKKAKAVGSELEFETQRELLEAEKNRPEDKPEPPQADSGKMTLKPDEQERLVGVIEQLRTHAIYWEFRYLNLFLVHTTQLVLTWLVVYTEPVSMKQYHAGWGPTIQNLDERKAVLNALERSGLISIKGDMMEVTERGRQYINWPGRPNPFV